MKGVNNVISSTEIIKGVSKKGKEYYAIEITLQNGYKMRLFPSYAESFIIKGLYDSKNNERR